MRSARLAREEREAQAAAHETLTCRPAEGPPPRETSPRNNRSASPSRSLWCRSRRCCCSTSPSRASTPNQTRGLIALIESIAARGVTILLIEHQMQVVMQLCRRIMVLDYSKKIAEGTPEEIRRDPAVLDAYLVAMLSVANVTVSYGGFDAVSDAALEVREGELVVLLGANGAGKTTLFRALSGMTRAARGAKDDVCHSRSVVAAAARDRRRRGVALPGRPEVVSWTVGDDQPSARRISLP